MEVFPHGSLITTRSRWNVDSCRVGLIVGSGDGPGRYLVMWNGGDDEGSFATVDHKEVIIISDDNVHSVASRMKLTL